MAMARARRRSKLLDQRPKEVSRLLPKPVLVNHLDDAELNLFNLSSLPGLLMTGQAAEIFKSLRAAFGTRGS